MDNRKTSQGFAKVSINILRYVVMIVIIVICASAAYNFGMQVFNSEGVDVAPGTDMTFTVEEGTTVKEFGETLEEFRVIKSANIFRVQSMVYEVKSIEPGTYTFNTSQNGEEIFKIISAGPEENKTDENVTE